MSTFVRAETNCTPTARPMIVALSDTGLENGIAMSVRLTLGAPLQQSARSTAM